VLVAVAVFGAGAAGCASARDRTVTESANGKTIRLAVGKVVAIELRETPGTGYAWRTTTKPKPRILRLLSARFVPDAHPPGVVGFGGTAIWRYRGKRPGRTSTVIKLFPPGVGRRAVRTFRLTVIARRPRNKA